MNIDLKDLSSDEIYKYLKDGHYFVLNDFRDKQYFYGALTQIILEGIEKIESRACRQEIEENGLALMHKYFPVDKLIYLDVFVREQTSKLMIQLAYSLCQHDLKVSSEFFIVPDDFLFKISYPFEIAVKSKVSYEQYVQYKQSRTKKEIRLTPRQVLGKVKAWIKASLNKSPKQRGYHGYYPYAANAYGPHLDSWYGSALDGINLWWAIAGVKEDNSMVLYPESFGKYFKYKPEFAYLPPEITLTQPEKVEIPDGSLLVFNSDLLHGSHLNLSNLTRIVIAPRLVINQPKFNPDSLRMDFDAWYSSEDIARDNFENPIKFPMKDNWGVLYEGRQKPHMEKRVKVYSNSNISREMPIELCSSEMIGVGEKMLVNVNKDSIIILRTSVGLQAIAALCPHLNINLIDGFHDEQHIYCPGHGVAFSLSDGFSKCDLLKVQVYNAYDRNGKIVIEHQSSNKELGKVLVSGNATNP